MMKRITLTQEQIEDMATKALESACTALASCQYKNMLQSYGQYLAFMSLVEDMNVCYEGNIVICEEVTRWIDLIEEEMLKLTVSHI